MAAHDASGDADGQTRVLAFLAAADAYPHPIGTVVRVQTHISHVFLAGDYVYKLKKAVVFPFLDFGSVAARERFCREELRLNRRLAAPVYLDVWPVVDDGGRLRLGGDGTAIDWVVRMRRLPSDRSIEALVEDGAVDDETIRRIADRVAAFHAAVEPAAGGDAGALLEAWETNLDGVRPMVGRFLDGTAFDVLADFGRTWVGRHDAILRARVDRGHVRDAHGDLRADHVYVLAEPLPALHDAPAVPPGIQIVDCIEFSPAFRAVDVAADLAFLAMDLESLGRPELARTLVERYAETAGDRVLPALVPFHACHRAMVRGKVEGLAVVEAEIDASARAQADERARWQLALAGRFAWRSGDPVVVACMGLSGTGKSAVAGLMGDATGFAIVSSDVLRRAMVPPGRDRYTADARAAVHARMRHEVEAALGARESVVVDATFLARGERDALARVVGGLGRRHVFLECVADERLVRRRLDGRDASAVSDARWDTYLAQRRESDPVGADEPVLRVDTSGAFEGVRDALMPPLWAWRQGRTLGVA